jgi:hypothetical protein
MTEQFGAEQFFFTTADEARNYFSASTDEIERDCFSGYTPAPEWQKPSPDSILSAGTYRVVDGSLYRLVAG